MTVRGAPRDERGAVLVAVMIAGSVLAVVAGAASARTVAAVRAVDAAVAREEALHAAEAVAATLVERLHADHAGWSDPGGPDPAVLGHGWRDVDAALRGVPLPADPAVAAVRADVAVTGPGPTFSVTTVARVRASERAVRVVARPAGVADLAWATVHAVADPVVTGGDPEVCAGLRWEAGSGVGSAGPVEPEDAPAGSPCVRTRLDALVAVEGPVHLDDAPRIDRTWERGGPLTTAAATADGAPALATLTTSDATDPVAAGLRGGPPLLLTTDPSARVGGVAVCALRGPTLIRFDGRATRLRSPRSHPRHDEDGGPDVACPWVERSALDDVVVAALPDPVVILVRSDPAARCHEHPLGIDPAEDAVVEQTCRDGAAFVWGEYLGATTVVAEQDVQVVWDVLPRDGPDAGTARLGLVAGRGVVLRRPVGPPLRLVAPFGTDAPFAGPGIPPFGAYPLDAPTAVPTRWTAPRIVAAIAAVGGALRIQNPMTGQWSDEPAVVIGALAQRFHGPTAAERRDTTGALQARTGRPLRVVHDARLRDAVPPALPVIRGAGPRILVWEEVLPATSGADP